MDEVKIKLSALWVALMLVYLLGDVMRIFSGDFEGGEIATIASFFKSFGAKKETYFLFTRSFL